MKRYVALLALTASVAIPAAGQPAMAQAPQTMAAPTMAPMTTEGFRQAATGSDLFEIESSRLALERSRNARVRTFAQTMVDHHTQTSTALNGGTPPAAVSTLGGAATGAIVGGVVGGPVGAAVGAGVGATAGAAATAGAPRYQASAVLDARKADMLNQLASLTGPRFDAAYGQAQRVAHRGAIALFSGYAQAGQDPQMRTFAQQSLPLLQQHYSMAQRLPGARVRRG